jgi:hypothetical protein
VLYEVSDYNFGYSDLDAEHWLVIDRELSLAYAALADRAREFLSDQHPPAPLLSAGQLSEARHDLERLLRDGLRKIKTSVNPADIERRVLEQHEAVQRMVAFLDNWNEEIA